MRKLNSRRRNNRTPTTLPAATVTISNRKNRYDSGVHDLVCIFVFLVNTEDRNVTSHPHPLTSVLSLSFFSITRGGAHQHCGRIVFE